MPYVKTESFSPIPSTNGNLNVEDKKFSLHAPRVNLPSPTGGEEPTEKVALLVLRRTQSSRL